MNKQQLVAKMVEESGLSKKDAELGLNAFVKVVSDALAEGDKVQLIGFGTFETRQRAAREGRNPRNPKEVLHIAAKICPAFKAGKQLKDKVNK